MEITPRKPGRPKALSNSSIPVVLSLYQQGFGYRAIARELRKIGVSADWSTVRRAVKANQGKSMSRNIAGTNSDTILTRAPLKKVT